MSGSVIFNTLFSTWLDRLYAWTKWKENRVETRRGHKIRRGFRLLRSALQHWRRGQRTGEHRHDTMNDTGLSISLLGLGYSHKVTIFFLSGINPSAATEISTRRRQW